MTSPDDHASRESASREREASLRQALVRIAAERLEVEMEACRAALRTSAQEHARLCEELHRLRAEAGGRR